MEHVATSDTILVSDICGYWEVIRGSGNQESKESLVITRNDRYLFLEQMVFIRISDGQPFCGTWELSEQEDESGSVFSIILNEIFEYIIVNIDDNEMVLTDRLNKLSLVKRL